MNLDTTLVLPLTVLHRDPSGRISLHDHLCGSKSGMAGSSLTNGTGTLSLADS